MLQKAIKTRVVGVDITYDHTTVAIVDALGKIIAETIFSTPDFDNINDFVSALTDAIVQLSTENGGFEALRSVGISAPSGNSETGCIENSPNLPWKGVIPLAAMLRDRLGLAVALANNAHVRALGERTFGAAHGIDNFIFITLGRGVGSCMFSNEHTETGYHGFSGEFGHTCIATDGRPCSCGNHGCLEAYVSTRGVVETARELMAAGDTPTTLPDDDTLTADLIIDHCNEGDALAIETMRRTGQTLGVALANYASIIDPEAIIFSGSLTRAWQWLMEPAAEAFERNVFSNIRGKVSFHLSTLSDNDRDVMGASVLAWRVKEYSLFK